MKNIFLLSILILPFFSCNDNEVPAGKYGSGVLVVNEGNFSDADGSLDFYSAVTGNVSHDIFNEANGYSPGGVIQSVYVDESLAYIIDQIGNRIDIVNSDDFTAVASIESGLSTPRYMVVVEGKGYVTNWGPFDANFQLNESYVAVIDLDMNAVSNTIPTNAGPEGIVSFGGNLFVANSFSNTVQVIDPMLDNIVSSITVADGPLLFAEDKENKCWLLSTSFVTGSFLSRLDLSTEVILTSFPIAGSAKSLVASGNGESLFYLSAPFQANASVFAIGFDATEAPASPMFSGPNFYGLGVHPNTGIIYVGNSNAFQGNGTVIRFQIDGSEIDNFPAGRGPNGFVFK